MDVRLIAAALVLFALLSFGCTQAPPAAMPQPTAAPTQAATPTPEPTVAPTEAPTVEPTADVTPEPTEEATPPAFITTTPTAAPKFNASMELYELQPKIDSVATEFLSEWSGGGHGEFILTPSDYDRDNSPTGFYGEVVFQAPFTLNGIRMYKTGSFGIQTRYYSQDPGDFYGTHHENGNRTYYLTLDSRYTSNFPTSNTSAFLCKDKYAVFLFMARNLVDVREEQGDHNPIVNATKRLMSVCDG
ncbi:MAG: hypothetical protein V1787_05825 [Candidatus Micrarchaeota archaeon]